MLWSLSYLGSDGAATVNLNAETISDEQVNPADALAQIEFDTAGTVNGPSSPYAWLTNGTASNYEVKATITAGTFSTGTSGSWLALSSARSWTVARTSLGSKSCTATFEIRAIADPSTILDTASITLTATVTS